MKCGRWWVVPPWRHLCSKCLFWGGMKPERAGRAQDSLAVMHRLAMDASTRACSSAWEWILSQLAARVIWRARVVGKKQKQWALTTRPSQRHKLKVVQHAWESVTNLHSRGNKIWSECPFLQATLIKVVSECMSSFPEWLWTQAVKSWESLWKNHYFCLEVFAIC